MKNSFHDPSPGELLRCQITNSDDLFEVIDLGHQPPCDALVSSDTLHQTEIKYPLQLNLSPTSGLGQLDYIVAGKTIYPKNYPYRSGISEPLVLYLRSFSNSILKHYSFDKNSLVIDIGSNDGTLLTGFKSNGMRVLGVEPTNMSNIAINENQVETLNEFFSESIAKDIIKDYGRAKIITMTNVFAHMSNLGDIMRGLKRLLDDDGIFITESQYLLDVLKKNQFDGIYHEHIRTYSLKSLVTLFEMYGLEVFDVQRAKRYGGNIRAYVANKNVHKVRNNVYELLNIENENKLFERQTWEIFRQTVNDNRQKLMDLAYKCKKNGQLFVADSCPGRGVVLINYYGLDHGTLPYVAQLPNSEKVGKFIPGTHIPIVDNSIILKDNPDYIVILAWHYADYIMEKWRKKGIKSKFILPLPHFKIIDN
jgi:hypothetical protein